MKYGITIGGRNGAFGTYIVRPKTLPAPAVVVLHEVFGVNADIRKTCDELAEQGFIAVAPDLFWSQEPGVDLSVTSEPDWQHGVRLYQAYDRDEGVGDVKDTADTVAKRRGGGSCPRTNERVSNSTSAVSLHPVHQCPESRAHLGRRQVRTVTVSGKDPFESVLSKPPK